MTVISTRNIDMARATEVDPRSPCVLSIVFCSRNLAACALRLQLPFRKFHPDKLSPHTRTAHHIHPCKKFNNLLQILKFDEDGRSYTRCGLQLKQLGI